MKFENNEVVLSNTIISVYTYQYASSESLIRENELLKRQNELLEEMLQFFKNKQKSNK